MNCTACSATIPNDAKFCPECGAKVTHVAKCPNCGADTAPDANFCGACGHRLNAASAKAMSSGTFDPAKEIKPVDPNVAAPIAVDKVFALFHDKDGDCKNATKADAELVAWAADKGNSRAMFLMGEIYNSGCDGFNADVIAANDWYRKAAEAGDSWAMVSYAISLANKGAREKNNKTDWPAAKEWAAKACIELGVMGELTYMIWLLIYFSMMETVINGSSDTSRGAALAKTLLKITENTDSITLSAVEKKGISNAHLVLAVVAKQNANIASAREHFEKGAALGDKDCQKALAELNGANHVEDGGDEVNGNEDEHYCEEEDDAEYVERHGESSNVSIEDWSFLPLGEGDAPSHFSFVISIANDSDHDTGTLSLRLWFCDNEYNGGEFSGYLMAEEMFYRPLLRHNCYDDYNMDEAERLFNPPTGDYHAVITINELNADGCWYVVNYVNVPDIQHWKHYED